ncbi:uncharacterized protein H6S33_011776 [Morchella sextelata]|uniref:uncharacterized protein n=1 Tax=Morchella sextelata TaxID=1174677 RepID=UPI001D03AA63|nr:uncharacterized protein H6S33_011776 [Morchella sextelata]KAH0610249.1 hypothetical protein H6S33_011776 [Morchella sextelata]
MTKGDSSCGNKCACRRDKEAEATRGYPGKDIKPSLVSNSQINRSQTAATRVPIELKRPKMSVSKPTQHSLGCFGKLPLELLTIIAKNLETVDQVRFIFSTHKSLRQLGTVPTIWENLLIHEKPRRNICRGFSDKIVPNLPGGCVRNLSIHCIGGKNHTYQPLNLLRELRLHDQTLFSLTLSGSQKSVHESLLAITLDDITDLGKLLSGLKTLIAHPNANQASKNIRPDQLITLFQLLPNLETLILENLKNISKPLCGMDLYGDMLGNFFPVLEKLHMGTIRDVRDCTRDVYCPLPKLKDFSATYSGVRGDEISKFFFDLVEGSPDIQEISFCCLRSSYWNLLCTAKLYGRPMKSPNLKQIRLGGWGILEEDMDGDWFYEDIWQRPYIQPKWRGCC